MVNWLDARLRDDARSYGIWAIGLLLLSFAPLSAEEGGQPRTFVLDLENLESTRQAWLSGNPIVGADMERLILRADGYLDSREFSVTFTPEIPPSGDKRDLVSYGAYFWPNPDTEDGLPWVFRDGFLNQDNRLDWLELGGLAQATEQLSLAYFFTRDEKYAEKAASLTRTFFLDEETGMNPRLEYSCIIPGVSDTGGFTTPGLNFRLSRRHLIDSIGLLEMSPHWTAEDKSQMQSWVSEFTDWAIDNPFTAKESMDPANHGTNFDFLFTLFGLYEENLESASEHYSNYVVNRMPGQIAADGSNPLEMTRANNLLYHRYNLEVSHFIGQLGTKLDDSIDFFNYELEDGRSMRKQIDFLLPYITGEKEWEYFRGHDFGRESPLVYSAVLKRFAAIYNDPELFDVAESLGMPNWDNTSLIYPESAVYKNYWPGDADLNNNFDSSDFVFMLQSGKYETDQKAYWRDGDFNGDRRFDSGDLVLAFNAAGYQKGPRVAATVPEPSVTMLSVGFLALLIRYCSRASSVDPC